MKRARARRRVPTVLLLLLFLFPAALLFPRGAFAQMASGLRADKILIVKHERLLFLLDHGRVIRTYPIALGWNPVGPKEREGDGRTPEGSYIIDGRTRDSAYDLALHISYPNAIDRMVARYYHFKPGGGIYIHGMPDGFPDPDPVKFFKDWTDGCIAVSDPAIQQIWKMVANGTPVEIEP